MKALFLHLSDLHFRYSTDALLSRVSRITTALGSVDAIADVCVVAVTGDVAFSGKPSEYALAEQFFQILQADLTKKYGDGNVLFLFVPGNHDCDFSRDSESRKLMLQSLPS